MNTTRRPLLIVGAVLICAAVVVLLAFTASANPENGPAPYTGRGEYQRYEAQFFGPDGEFLQNHPKAGMGDLRRFERQDSSQNLTDQKTGHGYAGMGDLRSFEAAQEYK